MIFSLVVVFVAIVEHFSWHHIVMISALSLSLPLLLSLPHTHMHAPFLCVCNKCVGKTITSEDGHGEEDQCNAVLGFHCDSKFYFLLSFVEQKRFVY